MRTLDIAGSGGGPGEEPGDHKYRCSTNRQWLQRSVLDALYISDQKSNAGARLLEFKLWF